MGRCTSVGSAPHEHQGGVGLVKIARVRISGVIEIADLEPPQIYPLRYTFNYTNPEWRAAIMRGIKHPAVKSQISLLRERPNGNIVLPRGTIREIRSTLSEMGVILKIARDDRALSQWKECPDIDAKNLTLRDYQREGANALAENSQGVITYPCGGGKTSTGIGCIAKLKQRAIVLVHTDDLLRQWQAAILGTMGFQAGTVRGGKDPEWKDITIVSLHKLRRMLEKDNVNVVDILKGYGLCILDESHHAPARTFISTLDYIPAYYRLGLTATPKREDGLSELMYWVFGQTLSERTVDQLVDAGYLTRPVLTAIKTGLKYEYVGDAKKKNEAIARAVYRSKERNQLIARNAIKDAEEGLVTIIMTSRKNHTKLLEKELRALGHEVPVLGGWSTNKVREETIQRMRAGEQKLIIAMPIFDEGVDVPALGAIHLSFPERAGGRLEQRAGRLMRPFKGQVPRLYDYVDEEVRAGTRVFDDDGNYVETKWSDILKNRWSARKKIYRKLGVEINWSQP